MRYIGKESSPELEQGGCSIYGGLVNIGEDNLISTYIAIYETSSELERMVVELHWWNPNKDGSGGMIGDIRELTEEEYDEILEIGTDAEGYELSTIQYCISEILTMRQGEKETYPDA
jgi:uncharacterized protein YrzB (UPF0473 family)